MLGMDDDQHTELGPEDFDRVQAELDNPTPPTEHLKRSARKWAEVRPQVVTSEERVAEHRARLDAEVELYRALGDTQDDEDEQYRQAMRNRKRGAPEA